MDRLGGATYRADLHAYIRAEDSREAGTSLHGDLCKRDSDILCETGQARGVPSPAASELRALYAHVVHTATPIWPRTGEDGPEAHSQWRERLASCYRASLSEVGAFAMPGATRPAALKQLHVELDVVVPLLGAGTHGAPLHAAAAVAADAASEWLNGTAQPGDMSELCRVRWLVQSPETGAVVEQCLTTTLGNPEEA